MAMDIAGFEADLRREGYELCEGKIEPHVHRDAHAHEFDARLFVLEGSITLVFGDKRCTYRAGDSCNVSAGTMHEEHTEAKRCALSGRASTDSKRRRREIIINFASRFGRLGPTIHVPPGRYLASGRGYPAPGCTRPGMTTESRR